MYDNIIILGQIYSNSLLLVLEPLWETPHMLLFMPHDIFNYDSPIASAHLQTLAYLLQE